MSNVAVSPAEIVRQCLVNMDLVVTPGTVGRTTPYQQLPYDGTVVCFVSSMPDSPDQVVCIRDVIGLLAGRSQRGRSLIHSGVMLLIRTLTFQDNLGPVRSQAPLSGFNLANTIAQALDNIPAGTVTIDGVDHYLQSVYRTSTLVDHGEEVGKKRQLWSVNARVAMKDQEPPLG